jgi:hypothetical protein
MASKFDFHLDSNVMADELFVMWRRGNNSEPPLFGAGPFTARGRQANGPDQLLSLPTARQDPP